jgi:hypothetical protein
MSVWNRIGGLALTGLAALLPWQSANATSADNRQNARLCYFSYNNSAEFDTVSRFVAQLNQHAQVRIDVTELQDLDADPEDAIRIAAKSGLRCDGLVLSGHQRKRKFWGDRSDGSIKAGYFDKMSCANDTAEWFQNVKAVWLEGCSTGLPELMNLQVKDKKRINASPLPLLQSRLDLDDLEDSIDDINDLLEDNLNEDNIAVDYLRIFPEAMLYTWTHKAPGEKAGSHNSLLFHVAQVSRLADPAPAYYQDPRGKLNEIAARRYGEVLYAMLTGVSLGSGKLNEANFLKGWHAHGDYRQKYAFDNHDLKAFPPLLHSNVEVLRQNRGLRCLLQTYKGKDNVVDIVNYIARNEHLGPYSDLMLQALLEKTHDQPDIHQKMLGTLAGSGRLMNYLAEAKGKPEASSLFQRLRAEATALADKKPAAVPAEATSP